MSREKPTAAQVAEVKKKVEPGYMAIKLPYKAVLVTHAEGVAIMAAMANAELAEGLGYGDPRIYSLNQADTIETHLMSRQMYLDIKMSALLGLSYKDYISKEEELPF